MVSRWMRCGIPRTAGWPRSRGPGLGEGGGRLRHSEHPRKHSKPFPDVARDRVHDARVDRRDEQLEGRRPDRDGHDVIAVHRNGEVWRLVAERLRRSDSSREQIPSCRL